MSRVGTGIHNARLQKGMSQKDLAKKLGVSESFLADVETGRKIVKEDLIARAEKLLGVDLNEADLVQTDEPVENIKETAPSKTINKQWEDAFSHVLKKLPVMDTKMQEIYDYKYLPVIDKKIEGYNPDKVVYIQVPDDSLRGFRMHKGDSVMLFLNSEMISNSISLIEIDGKRCIRQIKRLDSTKVLILSHYTDLKTETRDIKSVEIVGKCVRLEINL
jgi:transcriptional regulator with XRE-family HTH domain